MVQGKKNGHQTKQIWILSIHLGQCGTGLDFHGIAMSLPNTSGKLKAHRVSLRDELGLVDAGDIFTEKG
jgi:hypothetical protein